MQSTHNAYTHTNCAHSYTKIKEPHACTHATCIFVRRSWKKHRISNTSKMPDFTSQPSTLPSLTIMSPKEFRDFKYQEAPTKRDIMKIMLSPSVRYSWTTMFYPSHTMQSQPSRRFINCGCHILIVMGMMPSPLYVRGHWFLLVCSLVIVWDCIHLPQNIVQYLFCLMINEPALVSMGLSSWIRCIVTWRVGFGNSHKWYLSTKLWSTSLGFF